MPKDADFDPAVADLAAGWLADFDAALAARDYRGAAALFSDGGHWRDVLALDWRIATVSGRDAVARKLAETAPRAKAAGFRLACGRTPPRRVSRAGTDCIEAILAFETDVGIGAGVVRLIEDGAGGAARAWTVSTTLQELKGHPERTSHVRAGVDAFNREFGGENWLDHRGRMQRYEDRDPAVLVVGGGQAGLGVAARLTHLGVDTLIVDRYPRIGDNWRTRYHSLTLHNEVYVNHLPYMPFPPTWPVYIPKDMLANWFECYVEAMELNYWTGTELVRGRYDDGAGAWEVTLVRADGTERVMRPRHLVMATGVSAIPIRPDLPGLDDFAGALLHAAEYTTGHAWKGGRALVVGTGNSGHDVAQDLHASGVATTMVQRASTHIVSLAEAQRVYAIYAEGPPIEDCDLLATSFPFPVLKTAYRAATRMSKEIDRPLLEALEKRGFRLNDGVDDCGFQMSYLQRGGGYYFNVGCSDLIAAGEIGIVDDADIDRYVAEGARRKDGTTLDADVIVLATGYKNQQETARHLLGDAVADTIGPVWGFDDGGELRNMWCRTPQPGLWFTAGSLAQCRIYSRFLALQIKALEEGLVQ